MTLSIEHFFQSTWHYLGKSRVIFCLKTGTIASIELTEALQTLELSIKSKISRWYDLERLTKQNGHSLLNAPDINAKTCSSQSHIPHHHLISLAVYHHTIFHFFPISFSNYKPSFFEKHHFYFYIVSMFAQHGYVVHDLISFQLLTKFHLCLSNIDATYPFEMWRGNSVLTL